MHLDPSMSQGDVATLYAEAIHTLPPTRQRPLTDRIRTRVGILHSGRRSSQPWSALRSDWNRTYPDWPYHWEVPMSRDYRRALRRLLPTERYPLLGE